MNQKGLAVVNALSARIAGAPDVTVVAARDPHVQHDFYNEIETACAGRGIPFLDRDDARDLSPECAIAVGWRWMIRGCAQLIVFHDSLLPRYRGFAPLVTALINGDREVGVTALFGAVEYDRGEIIGQKSCPVQYPVKVQTVIERVSQLYAELAADLFDAILAGAPLPSRSQDEAAATYSAWRDEDDYRIDWSRDATFIRRFIDAVGYPYLGASSTVDGRAVRILEAAEEPDIRIEQRVPGKVILLRDDQPVVACGSGMLRLVDLRDEDGTTSLLPLRKFRTRFR